MSETVGDSTVTMPFGSLRKAKSVSDEGSPMMGKTFTQSTRCPEEDLSPLLTPTCDRSDGDTPSSGTTTSPWPGDTSPCVSPTTEACRNARNKLKAELPPAIEEEQLQQEESGDSEVREAPHGAPPGLSTPKAPSRGSGLHEQGDCSPCVWFWKPQGCHRGQECGYCHLCPEGEIKSRKKAKLATIRNAGSGSMVFSSPGDVEDRQEESTASAAKVPALQQSQPKQVEQVLHAVEGAQAQSDLESGDVADMPPPPGLLSLEAAETGSTKPPAAAPADLQQRQQREPLPSAGSELHGTGDCRPCAWFYKSQGCLNGAECRHCHLCGEGEIKARRKAKAVVGRKGSDDDDKPEEDLLHAKEPIKVSLPFPSRQSTVRGPLPSPGSALHGTGTCKPCAWFHKQQGCENGAECRHCHLCPEGEIRDRRKNKVATLKKQVTRDQDMTMEQALWMVQKQQEALIAASWQAQAMWEVMLGAGAGVAAEAEPPSPTAVARNLGDGGASPLRSPMPVKVPVEAFPSSPLAGALAAPSIGACGLPSVGSSLHGSGQCRPCAWFWKAQGCQNGASCAHCHLCPEYELEDRKRVKARMRASVPAAQQGGAARVQSPRVVKIAPILGA